MREIKNIKDFFEIALKSIAIGIAMFIPGVSGGTLALMMGMYDDLIESVAGITKHFKLSILYLIPLLIGGAVGYAIALLILGLGLKYIPIPTISLFAGLIIGGIPSIFKNVKEEKLKVSHILSFAIASIFVVALGIASIKFGFSFTASDIKAYHYIFVFLGGFLAAMALIVPGVSGSAVLLTLGLFQLITMESIPYIFKFNEMFGTYFLIDLAFGVGAILGLLTISKLMKYLLKNKRTGTFYAILGFVVGSIFAIYYNDSVLGAGYYEILKNNPYQYALIVIFLIGGIFGSYYFEKLTNKKENNKDTKEIKNETR